MKLSVSLPDEDVEFLDEYAAAEGVESRSAVLRRAVRLLRSAGLDAAYELAWQEWTTSGDDNVWDVAVADGLDD